MCIPHTWCHHQHWPQLSVALSAIISQDVYTLLSLLSRTLACVLASLDPVVIFLMSLHKGSSCLHHSQQNQPSLSYRELLSQQNVSLNRKKRL